MNIGDKVWFRPSGARETIDGMVVELEMARGLVEGTVLEVLNTLVPSVVVIDEEGEEHVVLIQNLRNTAGDTAPDAPEAAVEHVSDTQGAGPAGVSTGQPSVSERASEARSRKWGWWLVAGAVGLGIVIQVVLPFEGRDSKLECRYKANGVVNCYDRTDGIVTWLNQFRKIVPEKSSIPDSGWRVEDDDNAGYSW